MSLFVDVPGNRCFFCPMVVSQIRMKQTRSTQRNIMPPYSSYVSSHTPFSEDEEPQLVSVNSNSTRTTYKTLTHNNVKQHNIFRLLQVEPTILLKQKLPTIPERCVLLRDEAAPMLEPSKRPLPTKPQLSTISEPQERHVSFEKRVSFDRFSNETFEVLNRNDYTPKEKEATWYCGYEKFIMQQDARNVIRRNNKNIFSWDQRSKMRGLENHTPSGMHSLRIIRYNYMFPILAEQERQRRLQINDPSRLAEASTSVSNCSHMKALEVAKRDATDAQEIYYSGSGLDLENMPYRLRNLWEIPNEDCTKKGGESPFGPCFLFDPSQLLNSWSTLFVQDLNIQPTHRIVMYQQFTTITPY